MYTRIICPIDFSETAINAVEYAAQIAQKFSGKLFLLNVHPLISSELVAGNADALRETTSDNRKRLNNICSETNKSFQVACEAEVIVAYPRLEKMIEAAVQEKSMIVMGTSGIDDLYQYFFGTNTFNVIKKVSCPVWLVPEHTSYSPVLELVYACDIEKAKKYLNQVLVFAKQLNAKIHLLHVSKNDSDIPPEKYAALTGEIEKVLSANGINHSFEKIYSDDISDETNQYMVKKENSLLVMPVQDYTILETIFKKSHIKKISAIASYPVLFIH